MTGIAGFVTRAAAGLRAPKSISRKITPQHGGVAPHYGGPRQPAASSGADHASCISTWRNWQKYHMDTHGWADIAYTGGFCNHGYAFAGRGAGVRTAANGTNTGNQNFYAVVWIGGEGQEPTKEAIDALDWWVSELRKSGAGTAVKPHRWFKSTGCPGDPLVGYASSRDGKAVPTTAITPPTPPAPPGVDREKTKQIQTLLKLTADGLWGNDTEKRADLMVKASRAIVGYPVKTPAAYDIASVQYVVGSKTDGIWGPKSRAALIEWVKKMQRVLAQTADGSWGPRTDHAFNVVRQANKGRF